jgi:hypothetical protein
MKRVQGGAVACFAVALVFYLIAWHLLAWGAAMIALLLELALYWTGPDDEETPTPGR